MEELFDKLKAAPAINNTFDAPLTSLKPMQDDAKGATSEDGQKNATENTPSDRAENNENNRKRRSSDSTPPKSLNKKVKATVESTPLAVSAATTDSNAIIESEKDRSKLASGPEMQINKLKCKKCVVKVQRMDMLKYLREHQMAKATKATILTQNIISSPKIGTSGGRRTSRLTKIPIDKTLGKNEDTKVESKPRKTYNKVSNGNIVQDVNKTKRSLNRQRLSSTATKAELIEMFGSRYFRSYVKIQRLKTIQIPVEPHTTGMENSPSKSDSKNRSVSFKDSVQIFGCDTSIDDKCEVKQVTRKREVTTAVDDELDNVDESITEVKENTSTPQKNKQSTTTIDEEGHDVDEYDEIISMFKPKHSSPKLLQNVCPITESEDIVDSLRKDCAEVDKPVDKTAIEVVDDDVDRNDSTIEGNAVQTLDIDAKIPDDNSNSCVEKQTDSDISFSMQANNSDSSGSFASAVGRPLELSLRGEKPEINGILAEDAVDADQAEINRNDPLNGELITDDSPELILRVGSSTPVSPCALAMETEVSRNFEVMESEDQQPITTANEETTKNDIITRSDDGGMSFDLFAGDTSLESCQYMPIGSDVQVKKNVTEIIHDLTKGIEVNEVVDAIDEEPRTSLDAMDTD